MFYLTDNPFKGKVPDDKVKRYWDMYGTKSSRKQRLPGFRIFSSIRYAKIIYFTRTWKFSVWKEMAIACLHR